MKLSACDQVCSYLFERDTFFMPPRPGDQYVLDVLPQCLVFLEVDYRRRLAAFRVSDELNSGHGPCLLGSRGTCSHSNHDASPCQFAAPGIPPESDPPGPCRSPPTPPALAPP